MQGRPRVVHVSADFPDSIDPAKTRAIEALVNLAAPAFDQHVWSINRRPPRASAMAGALLNWPPVPSPDIECRDFAHGTALVYHAPPKGLLHAAMLHAVGDWLAKRLRNEPRPDLLIGHKLAVEGIAVRRAASHLGLPYGLSIQGDTDTKIMDARPDLRRELAQVFHGAAVVFPFAPWALQRVEARLGKRSGPVHMLPCATDIDQPLSPRQGTGELLSVFHLKSRKRKNLATIARAVRILADRGHAPPVGIVGGGTDSDFAGARQTCEGLSTIHFAGNLDRVPLRQRMNAASGFVLPSLRESFGMVFVEALFSGLPIIYPAGTAVDGYFDGAPFALRVDARDPAALADAMQHILREETAMKAALADWQTGPEAQRFTRAAIGSQFIAGIEGAVAGAGG